MVLGENKERVGGEARLMKGRDHLQGDALLRVKNIEIEVGLSNCLIIPSKSNWLTEV